MNYYHGERKGPALRIVDQSAKLKAEEEALTVTEDVQRKLLTHASSTEWKDLLSVMASYGAKDFTELRASLKLLKTDTQTAMAVGAVTLARAMSTIEPPEQKPHVVKTIVLDNPQLQKDFETLRKKYIQIKSSLQQKSVETEAQARAQSDQFDKITRELFEIMRSRETHYEDRDRAREAWVQKMEDMRDELNVKYLKTCHAMVGIKHSYEQKLAGNDDLLQRQDNALARLTTRHEKMTGEAHAQNSMIEGLRDQLQKMTTACDEKVEKIGCLELIVQKRDYEIVDLVSTKGELESKLKQQHDKISKITIEKDSNFEQLEKAQHVLSTKTTEFANSAKKYQTKLEKNSIELQRQLKSVSEHKKKLTNLTAERIKLERQLSAVKKEKESVEKKLKLKKQTTSRNSQTTVSMRPKEDYKISIVPKKPTVSKGGKASTRYLNGKAVSRSVVQPYGTAPPMLTPQPIQVHNFPPPQPIRLPYIVQSAPPPQQSYYRYGSPTYGPY